MNSEIALWDRIVYWKKEHKFPLIQFVCGGVIVLMAIADFLAIQNLFIGLDLNDSIWKPVIFGNRIEIGEVHIYPFICVVALEGLPTFMGMALATRVDPTAYNINDIKNAKIGFWIEFFSFLLTWLVLAYMRNLIIDKRGGIIAYKAGEYVNFIADLFLVFSPIITSLFAFAASWTVFRSEKKKELEKRLNYLHDKYLRYQSQYNDVNTRSEEAMDSLWTSLAVEDRRPQNFDDFRNECFKRIRNKLIENCISEYPSLMTRYNKAAIIELQSIQERMGALTSVPKNILDLSLNDMLIEYDSESNIRPDEKWLFDDVVENLFDIRLKKLLDNAVVVAQYKTSIKPYYLEGDKY